MPNDPYGRMFIVVNATWLRNHYQLSQTSEILSTVQLSELHPCVRMDISEFQTNFPQVRVI